MSPPGRSKGEYRSAEHAGTFLSPPGRAKSEYLSAQHEGSPASVDPARIEPTEVPAPARRIDAIAIGASAGGVQALAELLPALPAGLAAAVFVVIHLPRDQPSLLTRIFAGRCALAVRDAEDKEPVAPGTVYFAPPDYHLLIDTGPQLALSADPAIHHSRPSIDVLFESAAEVYGERLLAIVLTGANDDGAAGLQAVREAGGLTVVEDPATARAAQMPTAAIALGAPDRVLTLSQIAALLADPARAFADNPPP